MDHFGSLQLFTSWFNEISIFHIFYDMGQWFDCFAQSQMSFSQTSILIRSALREVLFLFACFALFNAKTSNFNGNCCVLESERLEKQKTLFFLLQVMSLPQGGGLLKGNLPVIRIGHQEHFLYENTSKLGCDCKTRKDLLALRANRKPKWAVVSPATFQFLMLDGKNVCIQLCLGWRLSASR